MELDKELYDKAVALSGTVERANPMFFQRHFNVGSGTAKQIINQIVKDQLISKPEAPMKHHDLKIRSAYYQAVLDGIKTFEIRKDDRQFRPGDTVKLREIAPIRWSTTQDDAPVSYTHLTLPTSDLV